ncbi:MAG: ABC transporter ATP-binding protein, partial [Thioalkalispiraceae bacterium]
QLLKRLHTETFVLNLSDPLSVVPESDKYPFNLIDETTLEVTVKKEQSINDVFSLLSSQGINVISMRNKSNRLEEMFLQMVEQGTL